MANIKFSQFTSEADYVNVEALVGYNGATNVRISPNDVINSWNSQQAIINLSDSATASTSLVSIGQSTNSSTVVNLLGGDNSYNIENLNAIRYNGAGWGIANNNIEVNTTAPKVISYIPYFEIGDGVASTVQLFGTPAVGGNFEFSVLGDQVLNVSPGSDLIIGPSDDITIFPTSSINISSTTQFGNDVLDTSGATGANGFVLASKGGGNAGVEWVSGYKAFQTFVWTNGTPVAYVNWPSATASYLPFDSTPLIATSNLPSGSTLSDYAWTCTNTPGGTAGEQSKFELGPNGAGTWKIRTCQHWFDQTSQVEMRVSLVGTGTGGAKIDIIDQKSTELAGDKIFYGELVQEVEAGDDIKVEVEFTIGGVAPFPSDAGNRPIEITFEKIV